MAEISYCAIFPAKQFLSPTKHDSGGGILSAAGPTRLPGTIDRRLPSPSFIAVPGGDVITLWVNTPSGYLYSPAFDVATGARLSLLYELLSVLVKTIDPLEDTGLP